MPRPRGDEWLADEIAGWRSEGLSTVVSLLQAHEVRELGLSLEDTLCRSAGIEWITFPIVDRGVPESRRDTARLVDKLCSLIASGAAVAIHCRAGIGRSALVAGCVLLRLGVPETEVFARISRVRGVSCPDTLAQIEWCTGFQVRREDER
jgi:protein-tyrosine phosphatase